MKIEIKEHNPLEAASYEQFNEILKSLKPHQDEIDALPEKGRRVAEFIACRIQPASTVTEAIKHRQCFDAVFEIWGRAEPSDKCEWTERNVMTYARDTSCGKIGVRHGEYAYCPFCGKQICETAQGAADAKRRSDTSDYGEFLERAADICTEADLLSKEVSAHRDAIRQLESERSAWVEKIKTACGTSEPSAGYDWVDEICALLRVTRMQRDDAEFRLNEAVREIENRKAIKP